MRKKLTRLAKDFLIYARHSLVPSIKNRLGSFPLVFSFPKCKFTWKPSYACFKHHSLVYVSFHKKSARRSLCTKDLLPPKVSSSLEDTPCKTLPFNMQTTMHCNFLLLLCMKTCMYASKTLISSCLHKIYHYVA